ncbi:MAG: ABC transporter ATP-binding protein [Sandaracinaceae bacterium]
MSARLEALGLRVRRRAREVLRGVDFEASAGELTSVLGPNGAGKSTLLSALATLLPSEGSITLDGADLRAMEPKARARRLAYVPQQTLLRSSMLARTVVEHGRYAHHEDPWARIGTADRDAVMRALARTTASELAERRFDRLSVGEQRRVLVARALATEAKVLLLDEPTEALDVRHTLELFALLRELVGEGYCVVAVLHDLDHARRYADRAVLIRAGELVASGPSEDVVSDSRVREVYGVALKESHALGYERLEAE